MLQKYLTVYYDYTRSLNLASAVGLPGTQFLKNFQKLFLLHRKFCKVIHSTHWNEYWYYGINVMYSICKGPKLGT